MTDAFTNKTKRKMRFPLNLIGLSPIAKTSLFNWYARLNELFPREIEAETFYGAILQCDIREYIQKHIVYFGVWEPDITSLIQNLLSDGDTFIDVGANIGYDTLLGAKTVGHKGSVVAIEASPTTFAKLESNIGRNNVRNVRAVAAAVSNKRGDLDFFDASKANTGAGTTIGGPNRKPTATVPAFPLDEILTDSERQNASLLKIDVEGAELDVLNDIADKIHMYPRLANIIAEITPTTDPMAWSELWKRYQNCGFEFCRIRNDYSPKTYLSWRAPAPLQRLPQPPDEIMIDVLIRQLKVSRAA